ncbi:MAG: DegV family protein [Bacillota bacterium]|nr:DegV family protein [Bacillota bacterium]
MLKTAIFVDSVCDVPEDDIRKHGIKFVPLTVHFKNQQFVDKKEINCRKLFTKIKEFNCMPVTSQPSPDTFMKAFREEKDCSAIICITMTSHSSGTFDSASMARDMLIEEGFKPPIYVVDSLNVSHAAGILAIKAAEMAEADVPPDRIAETVREMANRASIYFVVETLEYMRRGGRIGAVKATIGTLFNIKPILTFFKGIPTDVDKVRGMEQAKEWLMTKFSNFAETLDEVTVIHADAYEDAKVFAKQLGARFKKIRINIQEIGAVLAVYAGPKALGLTFLEKAPK